MKELEIKAKVDTTGIKNLEKSTDKAADSAGELNDQFAGTSSQLDKMTGGAVTFARKLVAGVKQGVTAMTTLKGAIIATGIGALVVVVGTLVSYFTNTQRGADKLNQAFKVVGATVDVLTDRLSSFGEGLFQILSGDFEKGWETLKGSVKGVADEIVNESKAALQLEKDMQALQDREIEFIKVQAEKRRAIEQARLAAEDESLSDKERAEALQEAIRIQNELTDEQIAIEKERARIIRERVALGESSRDDIREQAEAEARIIELETERDRRLRSVQTRLNAFTDGVKENTDALEKEAKAAEEAAKKQEELNKKREEELALLVQKSKQNALDEQMALLAQAEQLENEYLNRSLERQQVEKNAIIDKYFSVIEAARAAGQDVTMLEEAQAAQLADIDKKYADQRVKQEESVGKAKEAIAMNAMGAIGGLLEKGSQEAKAFASAQVLFDTFKGIQAAFASNAANTGATVATGGSWPFIQAAAAGIFGFGNLAAINAAPTKGGSGGGARSVSIPSASSDTATQVVPNFQSINRGVGGTQGADFQPPKAYVVSQEIRDNNARSEKILDQSRAGK